MGVDWEGLRRTEGGYVVADLVISADGAEAKYSVYLRDKVRLIFQSADRDSAELAARLLGCVDVDAEVKKMCGVLRIQVYMNALASGHEELRKALAEIVREAAARGWIDAGKAGRWLKKLEKGPALREGWPKYRVRLVHNSALDVRYQSTSLGNIKREVQRLENMGLKRGIHFTVKMPEDGMEGYVYIRREGLACIAQLSARGKDEQQRRLASQFVKLILQRAEGAGKEVYEKAAKVVEGGASWGSLTLERFKKKVKVGGVKYKVKVLGGGAAEEGRGGRKLLRIKITAEVRRIEGGRVADRVVREYTITFGRYGKLSAVRGFAVARAGAPGGREADAERLSALIKALTGRRPGVHRMKSGVVVAVCGRQHLESLRRFKELAEAVERWLSQPF